MVKVLMAVVGSIRSVWLLELAGVVAVVVGLVAWFGGPAGWVAAGVALLAKSAEIDLDRR